MRIVSALVVCLLAGPTFAAQPGPIKFPVHRWQPKPLPSPFVPKTDPTPVNGPVTDLANFLATFAIPDLQAALTMANNQNPPDITSAACWGGLIPIVQQIQSQLPQGQPIGIATAVQIARDFINAPTSPVVKQINMACAALYIDTKVGVVNFAAQLGGVLAGAAILAPIKPIP